MYIYNFWNSLSILKPSLMSYSTNGVKPQGLAFPGLGLMEVGLPSSPCPSPTSQGSGPAPFSPGR